MAAWPITKTHTTLCLTVVCLFMIDRVLKIISLSGVKRELVNGLWFILSQNSNAAFSLKLNFNLVVLSATVITLAIFWLYRSLRQQKIIEAIAITALILGALSNFYDRILYGVVIDYFDLRYFTIFNVADVLIVGGAGLFLWRELFQKKAE